jgi:signal transduction histidine kinase/CheY-like chemotaxis protein
MPIRTYLILMIVISTAGGVGLAYIQSQRNQHRLEAAAEIRRAETFLTSLRPVEDTLRSFFSTCDLYLGSQQIYLATGAEQQLDLFSGFFKDVEKLAPGEKHKKSVRKLASDLEKIRRFLNSADDSAVAGEPVPYQVLDDFDRESSLVVEEFENLRALAEKGLAGSLRAGNRLGQSNRSLFVVSVVVFVVVAFALLQWVSRSISSPIAELTASAELVVDRGGYFQARTAGASEVRRLSDSIGHMTNSLETLVLKRTDELHQKNYELNEEISHRAETEKKLRDAKTTAEAANAAKSDFLAVMSHELRTPLNSILGFSDVLKEGIQGEMNEDQLKSLGNISASGKHLLSLINDILDLSKIEAGKETLTVESIGIESICRDTVGLLRNQAAKKGVELKLLVAPEAKRVRADRRRLRQILFNLLSNAVKFTPQGKSAGLDVALRRRPPADEAGDSERKDGYVRFSVWDEGIGISDENQKKLFQPFVQVDSRLARSYEGTGLGLSLVKRLVKMHGGRIKVESGEGQGSRFSAYIPWSADDLGTENESALLEDSAVGFFRNSPNRRPMVLLVEDNQMNQQSITAYLEANRFEVLVADDGETALRLTEGQGFDLILTDVQMAGMDGLELTRELRHRERTRNLPIVALTAQAMDGDRERCLEAGMTDYLSKPLDLKMLVELANKLTGRPVESTV